MVEHLPVSINTKSIQYLFIYKSKVCKKNGLWAFPTGKVKKNFGKL